MMSDNINNSNIFKLNIGNFSDSVNQLNKMILNISWKEVDFDNKDFSNGLKLDSSLLNDNHKKLIELIVKLMPEWEKVICCKQHTTHDYCLDIHTLQVVKKLQQANDYKNLNEYDQLVLTYSAYLHDIEKNESEVDPQHPIKSANVASDILYRLGFDDEFINEVYLLIKNHQLIGLIVAERLKLTDKELFKIFPRKNLLYLLIILTIADIKAVKKQEAWFYKEIKNNLSSLQKRLFKLN